MASTIIVSMLQAQHQPSQGGTEPGSFANKMAPYGVSIPRILMYHNLLAAIPILEQLSLFSVTNVNHLITIAACLTLIQSSG
jgi:hypothetical protein